MNEFCKLKIKIKIEIINLLAENNLTVNEARDILETTFDDLAHCAKVGKVIECAPCDNK